MRGLPGLLLTEAAGSALAARRDGLRGLRGLGPLGCAVWLAGTVILYGGLRLEGPQWRALCERYRCYFERLNQRPYRWGDPLRYGLQLAWLLCVMPARPAREGRAGSSGRRWLAGLHASLGRGQAAAMRFVRRLGTKVAGAYPVRAGRAVRSLSTRSRAARWVLIALAAPVAVLVVFVVTQPFDEMQQLIFVSLLFGVALVVRKIPGRLSLLTLMVLSVVISTRYLWWRYTETLSWVDPLDASLGILLVLAETYSWLVLLLGYVQVAGPLHRKPVPLPDDVSLWPSVDVFIPTYNESLAVVAPTLYAALRLDWPADKLRIHLLDDGRRDAFRDLARELGIHYVTRPDNRHAKAGNLNHALAGTQGELVAIFDCDHIPVRSFLQVSVGLFLKDPKLALVQLPHHFFSPDPFERNLRHFGTQPNENALFYGLVQDGNDLWNAAFFCGSCAVLRRTALEAVGGVTVETVTEDAHTALRLHRAGYNSAYLQVPQAAGLATESLSAHVGQRIRWARGMIQIFRLDNPLFGKGLGFFQRLCYFNAMLHFLSGVPRLVYLISPLAFLMFHAYIVYAPGVAILLNVVPHLLHANLTNSRVQGSWRRTLWGEIYETVLSWYIARPTTVALLAPHQGKFNVTAKGGLVERRFYDWAISSPYVLLALANVAGFGFGVWRLAYGPADEVVTVLITLVWVSFNLVILGGAIAVAEELRQVRHNPRVPVSLPVNLRFGDGHVLGARMSDYAAEGVGARLLLARRILPRAPVTVCLSLGACEFAFPAHVVRCEGTELGIRLDPMDREQEIQFVQCTFGRADAWVSWHSRFQADQPVRSVLGILKLGVQGYGRMLGAAPAPVGTVWRLGRASAAWLGSFVPLLRRPSFGAGPIVLESAHESALVRLPPR